MGVAGSDFESAPEGVTLAVHEPPSGYSIQQVLVSDHEVDYLDESQVADVSARLLESQTSSYVLCGDAGRVLSSLPDDLFSTCVTSPPYWSLRDYGFADQIGLEDSMHLYIDRLVAAFEQVRRVLRDDGTLWLNIGDSYTSGNRTWRAPDKKNPIRAMEMRPPTPSGLKPKDLIGIPWRLALALQEAGWYLRADCIWNKPNVQPESVRDRPTRSHEYIFLFSKSERYQYDNDAERGPNERRLRTVWDINTQGNGVPHYATYPKELVRRCLALTTERNSLVLDPFLGSGTTGVVALEMRRRVVGVELNPEYASIALAQMRRAPGG